ncbi:MAG TPA: class I SAM-dependent methyltransferase [Anaerolineae bacterium]|nr:class I SAM-dependent methyltransferase [Anaerolineae bacterium]HMR68477.1 class I SAM-dependent methyltransferase [Anaerolineae bacterium]
MQVDPWESGNPYEFYIGRWSRPVAHKFLEWLSPAERQRWLDVGCGTGVLSSSILEVTTPQTVLAVDTSETFIVFAQQTYQDPRLRFQVGDACKLPTETGNFDVVVSGLALNFIPVPLVALTEMVRATRTGGVVAIYVWDYAKKMQMLRYFWDAAIAIDPRAKELDEGERFPFCQPSTLEGLFEKANLKKVEVRAIDVPTIFRNFDDYWSPFLGGQGPAPGYIKSLSNDQRKGLEKQLHTVLPVRSDGTIALIARAWAVRGAV